MELKYNGKKTVTKTNEAERNNYIFGQIVVLKLGVESSQAKCSWNIRRINKYLNIFRF